jgi:hypothetical protein
LTLETKTISEPSRRQGWWGVAFVVVLLVEVVMVSLPTSKMSGDRIKAFYEAHRQIIIVQQIIGALALVPFFAFVIALDRRAGAAGARWVQWLLPAGVLFAACVIATIVPPLALALLPGPSPDVAHTWTLVEDLADTALFASMALFSLAAAAQEVSWVRALGFAVAALTLLRAVLNPLGITALDIVAPIAFLAFVLVLTIRILVARPRQA